ncbi:hypothetical protein DZD52_10785 [Xanthomonas nasturtii]|uniref:Uncharacterized protein n=1 Tax=Xanthomonas nasturtii TaxID=1843581 RepID=A0A3E1KJY0_9XANT|nr:hypothetical protein DZD52_10785 [Xanthomonas nasturtii]
MSMSDREIWIPPVPALSDIGAYNAESPGTPGLSVFVWMMLCKRCSVARPSRGPYAEKNKGRQSPDYRPLRYPIARAAGPCSNSSLCAHVAMPRQVQ